MLPEAGDHPVGGGGGPQAGPCSRQPGQPPTGSSGCLQEPGDHPPVVKGAILFFGVFRAKGNILLFSHLVSKRSRDTDMRTE